MPPNPPSNPPLGNFSMHSLPDPAASGRGKPFIVNTQHNHHHQKKNPNRSTKNTKKLVLFPSQLQQPFVSDGEQEQQQQQPEPQSKIPLDALKQREAERIGRLERNQLSRVTAYCTASSYDMASLMRIVNKHQALSNSTAEPRVVDECLFVDGWFGSASVTAAVQEEGEQVGGSIGSSHRPHRHHHHHPSHTEHTTDADTQPLLQLGSSDASIFASERSPPPPAAPLPISTNTRGQVFFFDYGVVVFWDFSEAEEHYFLRWLEPVEQSKLSASNREVEEFHMQYRPVGQPRIFNDVIILRQLVDDGPDATEQDLMIKLTISHSIAQSVKLTLFEGLIDDTIDSTKHIPSFMARTGKVPLKRRDIIRKIGHLFVMRMNVNLISPILDTPELFWSEPALGPVYEASRAYLEIGQRVQLLNQRVSVLSDLLEMLKEHLTAAHGEFLEWIIIILIAIEILIGFVTIFFDFFNLYSGGSG